MPKYLIQDSLTDEGVQGLLKEGGSKRVERLSRFVESVGGTLECYYFAFGETDIYAIVDLPDHATMSASSLVANASGSIRCQTTVLLTPGEVDEAVKKSQGVDYRPPGTQPS